MRSAATLALPMIILPAAAVSSFIVPESTKIKNRINHNGQPTSSTQNYLFTMNKKLTAEELENSYPEGKPATYDLMPGEIGLGPESIVRPLLKQTQLQNRKLKVVYDAKKHGWDARTFHAKVDAKGASVVLAKCRGQWIGGYNPRGWASLGGVRSSVASFLFYQKFPVVGGWQKLRVSRNGSMACGKDEFDAGIYFGADSLVIPLTGDRKKLCVSRLGYYFETGPGKKTTLLPLKGADSNLDELFVISGVYGKDEVIPNSGGVSELGFF
eukprot:CAMPEP_0181088026 /NCGR_PEP_ID=MMETSP1071-20121207/6572_1 /TAXON_ID=35127 /ORGANISM="Thalassiosira sp., Strain NH16" /LENGTH=268 /DNA_ID=CAMNT_0023169925 /DNA_START=26 /DNA_END=832 /DNA_ORIENTATION=+